jgi:CRISPR system Cascade subunit CasE
MKLYLMQCMPEATSLATWAARQQIVSPDGDYGYALHALLAAGFGEHAPKPFRYLDARRGLLAYSSLDADTLRSHAALAAPDVARALGLDHLDARVFPSQWKAGQRLAFEVRVRPTQRTKDGRERDAFLCALENAPKSEQATVQRELVYREWLVRQLQVNEAAQVQDAHMTGFQLIRVLRRGQADEHGKRKPQVLAGPDVLFTGELVVADPLAFANLLARGVGRHRAFGFGMLLLKPAR